MTATESPAPIRIVRVSHMHYKHKNLAQAKEFLEDFGMHVAYSEDDGKVLYMAGDGPDAYVYIAEQGDESEYLGGALLVETKEDLERASAMIPGAGKLHPAGPAGGFRVTFPDPDGTPVNLVWGLEEREPRKTSDVVYATNYPAKDEKPRKGEFVRFTKGKPCSVYKLGHFGLLVSDFQRTFEFFTKYFNVVPTDFLTIPDGPKVAAFCHIDRGEEWVDHHSFFFSQNSIRTGTHHCSFEVHDPDVQFIGHEYLKSKGYNQAWGIGRHILGSQLFDYWYSPDDFLMEHYSDGDQVNCHTETGFNHATDESLAIWGPAVPEGFTDALPAASGRV